MSGTNTSGGPTTTDRERALVIPFASVFTVIELNGAGHVVVQATADGPKAYAASNFEEAKQVMTDLKNAPPPSAPVMTSMQIGGKSIAIPQGGTAEVKVGDAPTEAAG